MNLTTFETKALCRAIADRGLAPSQAFWAPFQNPPPLFATAKPDPLLNHGIGPPPISPKPYNALREKIINEGLSGLEVDILLQQEFEKEQFHNEIAKVYGVPLTAVSHIPPPDL